jgi:hypothetical protein
MTHSRPCACGPRLRPSGGTESPESVRQRSNLVMLLTDAQCQELEIDHTRLRASAKYGLRQAASSGQETINWLRSSSGQTWRFRASVFASHGDQDKSTAEVQHSDHECRGDGNQVSWCAVASLPQAVRRRRDAGRQFLPDTGVGTSVYHLVCRSRPRRVACDTGHDAACDVGAERWVRSA